MDFVVESVVNNCPSDETGNVVMLTVDMPVELNLDEVVWSSTSAVVEVTIVCCSAFSVTTGVGLCSFSVVVGVVCSVSFGVPIVKALVWSEVEKMLDVETFVVDDNVLVVVRAVVVKTIGVDLSVDPDVVD